MNASLGSAFLTMLVVPVVSAVACECNAPANLEQSIAEEFQLATAIFRGVSNARSTVDLDLTYCQNFAGLSGPAQLKCWATTEIEFVVSQVWKGEVPERMAVRTAPRDAACGTGLEQGREYIVFAYAIPNDDALHMNLCSPTTSQGGFWFDGVMAFLGRRASTEPRRNR